MEITNIACGMKMRSIKNKIFVVHLLIKVWYCFTADACVPSGYMTFKDDCTAADVATGEIRSRDVTSPIRLEDHTDSSTGRGETHQL